MAYEWAWPDELSIHVRITWSKLYTYDMLNDGQALEDESAYFYSLVLRLKNEWWPMYIGMVYEVCVSLRLQAQDHLERRERLRKKYPGMVAHLSLGTPEFLIEKCTKDRIRTIEHLLIYSNWHEGMLNKRSVQNFNAPFQVLVENCGFADHLITKSGYGVFYTNDV